MSKEGKGRNKIVYELALGHVKVSSGSVSNILNEDKNNKSKITHSIINTKVDLKYSGSPSSEILDGVGLTDVTTNNHGWSGYAEDIKKDGGPLSWLIKEARTCQSDPLKSEVSAVNNISGKVINTSLIRCQPDVDFADTPYQ